MEKDMFLEQLKQNGYTAELTGSVPTVYVTDMSDNKGILPLAKSRGYNKSFGVKLTKPL